MAEGVSIALLTVLETLGPTERVAARRPRARVGQAEQQAVVERFLVALRTGQVQELVEIMAPDVVLITDGGGFVAAARAPIHGAELVAKLLVRAGRVAAAVETAAVWINGAPAGRIEVDGQLAAVSLVVEDGKLSRIYVMANPRKLTRLDERAVLSRCLTTRRSDR
ncbi:sigma-70 family RNA polymerase sigma factor family protein [Pseudonocardia sp. DLS-67]